MTNIEGGCLCGSIRYSIDEEPTVTAICYCKNCQKQSGSGYSIVFSVNSSSVTLTGETIDYPDRADSGSTVMRRFCGRCGSPLISEISARPGVTVIKAGTLDDSSWLKPQLQVWCKSAPAWIRLDPEIPQYDGPFKPEASHG